MQSCIEDCNSSICGSYASKNNPITGQSGMVSCPTAYGPEVSTHNTVTRSTYALIDLSAPSQWCIVSKCCAGNTVTATYCMRKRHCALPLCCASHLYYNDISEAHCLPTQCMLIPAAMCKLLQIFRNCVDVRINGSGGGGGTAPAPAPAPAPPAGGT
jgi:hypothetical protein